jgi:transposase
MIDMVRRHEIQVLRRAGHSLAETAKLVGVSQSSVQRVEAEASVSSFDSESEREKRRIGRPSKAEPFRSFLVGELIAQPDVLAVELLRRARNKGYAGGKSALYTLVKELRPERPRPIVRFEGLPGEFSQHDFGEVDVKYLDGRVERVHFFASRLQYSRWVQVSLVANEQVEALVRAMVDHFAAWGGIPLLAVFDRPKTVALKWSKDGVVTDWNPTFAAVALDLGLGVELCWPRSPEQKGSVENLVGWVKGSFFKQRRFVDKDDVLTQLVGWHDEVNTKRPSRATRVIPAERLAQEKPRLRALRVNPAELALRIPIYVGPTWPSTNESLFAAKARRCPRIARSRSLLSQVSERSAISSASISSAWARTRSRTSPKSCIADPRSGSVTSTNCTTSSRPTAITRFVSPSLAGSPPRPTAPSTSPTTSSTRSLLSRSSSHEAL